MSLIVCSKGWTYYVQHGEVSATMEVRHYILQMSSNR